MHTSLKNIHASFSFSDDFKDYSLYFTRITHLFVYSIYITLLELLTSLTDQAGISPDVCRMRGGCFGMSLYLSEAITTLPTLPASQATPHERYTASKGGKGGEREKERERGREEVSEREGGR
jgi:hypothetical protein